MRRTRAATTGPRPAATSGEAVAPRSERLRRAAIAVPAILAGAVFLGVLDHGFVYDDPDVVQSVQGARSAGDLVAGGRTLHFLLLRLETALHGGTAFGYHATSLLVHVLATALAALVVKRITGDAALALITGSLFALHPVHVEVVASVANRKDALATAFVFGALLARTSRRMPTLGYWASQSLLAAGLMAKEVAAIGGLVILFLVDLDEDRGRPIGRRVARAALRALPMAIVCLGALALATGGSPANLFALFHRNSIATLFGHYQYDYPRVLLTAVAALPEQARLLVVPNALSPDYPVRAPTSLFAGPCLLGLLVLAAWCVATRWSLRHQRWCGYGLVWTAVMLLPASNVVPLTRFFVAERYLYAPSFGACLAGGVVVTSLHARVRRSGAAWRRAFVGATVAVLAAAAVQCVVYARCWRSEETLWRAVLAKFPEGTLRAHIGLARVLSTRGQHGRAAWHLQRLLETEAASAIFEGMIVELVLAGRLNQVELAVQRMEVTNPGNGAPRFLAGHALLQLGRVEQAARYLRQYLSQEPTGRYAADARHLLQEAK